MVELKGHRLGANLVGDKMLLAACVSGGGHLLIDTLKEIDIASGAKSNLEESGALYFGVSEKEAIIKRIKIPQAVNLDPEKLAMFEFLASLPGREENYYLEIYNQNGFSEYLAVAYQRELIQRRIVEFEDYLFPPSGFRLRSLAMGSAFVHYCRPMGGDLICLLDLSGEDITFCILNCGHPVATGHLANDYIRLEKEIFDTRRFLSDLTAILQFHVSLLFNSGHSVPLSLLVLSGTEAGSDLAGIIGDRLKIKAAIPEFRPELFVNDLIPSAHRYFINLGLTAGF